MEDIYKNWVNWHNFEMAEFSGDFPFLRKQCHFCKFMFDQSPPDDSNIVYMACQSCRDNDDLETVVHPYNKGK